MNTWSSRLLCIAPHQPMTNRGHVMDDPVVPYFPRSNGSSTTISSSQSGNSIADRCALNVVIITSSNVLCIALGLALHHRYHRNHLLLYTASTAVAVSNRPTAGSNGMECRSDILEWPLMPPGVRAEDHPII